MYCWLLLKETLIPFYSRKIWQGWFEHPIMGKLILVDSLASLQNSLEAHRHELVIMNLNHSFCADCLKMRPKFRREARLRDGVFLEVELGNVKEAVDHYGVERLPTFVSIYEGDEVARCAGRQDSLASFVQMSWEKKAEGDSRWDQVLAKSQCRTFY